MHVNQKKHKETTSITMTLVGTEKGQDRQNGTYCSSHDFPESCDWFIEPLTTVTYNIPWCILED